MPPDQHPREEADDADGARDRLVLHERRLATVVEPRDHRRQRPKARLPEGCDGQDTERPLGEAALEPDDRQPRIGRHDQHEGERGAARRQQGDLEQLGRLGTREAGVLAPREPPREPEQREHQGCRASGDCELRPIGVERYRSCGLQLIEQGGPPSAPEGSP